MVKYNNNSIANGITILIYSSITNKINITY